MKHVSAGAAALGPALGLALGLALAAPPAWASAWTLPQGQGQAIVTGVHSHSDKGFDTDGEVIDIADYTKDELYLLVEYGVTDALTVIVNPSIRHVSAEGGEETSGFGYTELGARYRLAQGGRFVASVQGSARIPGERRRDSLAQVGTSGMEYDVRGLVGTGFELGGAPGFVDLQGGYRVREGGPPNEFRLDATLGIRPAPRVQLFAQSFSTFSDGAGGAAYPAYRYHNAYLSGVYELNANWSVQLTGLATLGGENALRERGVSAGLWYRFGGSGGRSVPPPLMPGR